MNPISLGGEGVGKQGKGGMKERKGKGECTHSKNMYLLYRRYMEYYV